MFKTKKDQQYGIPIEGKCPRQTRINNMVDLCLLGAHFTCSNNQDDLAMSKTNRFFVSSNWIIRYPFFYDEGIPMVFTPQD